MAVAGRSARSGVRMRARDVALKADAAFMRPESNFR
jgi:hypothetical protein